MGGQVLRFFMAGIDFTLASFEQREKVAFVRSQVESMLPEIKRAEGVSGCVLLATCNRTELYLYSTGTDLDPLAILCEAADLEVKKYRQASIERVSGDVIRHIMRVASGLESQIFGDDQILSQVREARLIAREAGTSGPVLDTLFRRAVTAGKRVRTCTRLKGVPASAAERGVVRAEEFFGTLAGRRALVIGNGEMGRLAAASLRGRGAEVTVTLRSYRHGETLVPSGCTTGGYDRRYELLEGTDLVISATASPHFTITAEGVRGLTEPPSLFIDLAMPRDIEQGVAEDERLTVWNLDDLGDLGDANVEERAVAGRIIGEEEKEFYEWYYYRESLPEISKLKEELLMRLMHDHSYGGLLEENDFEGLAELAVNKTVDLLLGSMKDAVNPERLGSCIAQIKRGSGR